MANRNSDIIYPPGVRELTSNISVDDLVRRLKECAQAFQNMNQDEDNSNYKALAQHLASETFVEHNSKDVKLLAACCIADVFRIYAPEPPFEYDKVKELFEFFIKLMDGLKQDPQNPSFKLYFYLLENFACVKTFNILLELGDTSIIQKLFKKMFDIISHKPSAKVKRFILDILGSLLNECEKNDLPQELLEIILSPLIPPTKTANPDAHKLALDVIKNSPAIVEETIMDYCKVNLMLGQRGNTHVSKHLLELVYELGNNFSTALSVLVPHLESKLRNSDDDERLKVTALLARMFSEKNSDMISQYHSLWGVFLCRFNDINTDIRKLCVDYAKSFLINHPECQEEITEHLKSRQHDVEEEVRLRVVTSIICAAKDSLSNVNEELLGFVKERTLDRKPRVRKESLLSLASLHKQFYIERPFDPASSAIKSISWIKDKVFHVYYQTSIEDRLLVERILHTCLVPFQLPVEKRMRLLYQLYCSIDEHAIRAFKEIIRTQNTMQKTIRAILECVQRGNTEKDSFFNKVQVIVKHLPDADKCQPHINKFFKCFQDNNSLRVKMLSILNGEIASAEIDRKVKEILKSVGAVATDPPYYTAVKKLLERVAPLITDKVGIKHLVSFVKDSLSDSGVIEAELGLENSAMKGLEFLFVLSYTHKAAFQDKEIFYTLISFLEESPESREEIVIITLKTLHNIVSNLEARHPDVCDILLPRLKAFVNSGTVKQAKHAVYCINNIISDKLTVFGELIENLKEEFTLDSKNFRTALVSFGHIAFVCHDLFATEFKSVITKLIVQKLMLLDASMPREDEHSWDSLESLPDETKVKIEGMKVIVRWLTGLGTTVEPATSSLKFFSTIIINGGDILERNHTSPLENAWMRLTAASCLLKLCQEAKYAAVLTLAHFQAVAYVILDPFLEVRDKFIEKLHKGLHFFKLRLEFLAIYVLAAVDTRKEFREQVKKHLFSNIVSRRNSIKEKSISKEKLPEFLPDYALPYAVHLLAHAPFFNEYSDIPSLTKVKECLQFFMEPLMAKNENYSFAFYKRLLENIKQTKDKQYPDDEGLNFKLYAVCDLALSIVMSKSNYVLVDFPAEPVLNSKFFTNADPSYSNMKTYLPPEMITVDSMKTGFEVELFKMKNGPATQSAAKTVDEVEATATNGPVLETSGKDVESSTHNGVDANGPVDQQETSPENMSDREEGELDNGAHPSQDSTANSTAASTVSSRRIRAAKKTLPKTAKGKRPVGAKITDYLEPPKKAKPDPKEKSSKAIEESKTVPQPNLPQTAMAAPRTRRNAKAAPTANHISPLKSQTSSEQSDSNPTKRSELSLPCDDRSSLIAPRRRRNAKAVPAANQSSPLKSQTSSEPTGSTDCNPSEVSEPSLPCDDTSPTIAPQTRRNAKAVSANQRTPLKSQTSSEPAGVSGCSPSKSSELSSPSTSESCPVSSCEHLIKDCQITLTRNDVKNYSPNKLSVSDDQSDTSDPAVPSTRASLSRASVSSPKRSPTVLSSKRSASISSPKGSAPVSSSKRSAPVSSPNDCASVSSSKGSTTSSRGSAVSSLKNSPAVPSPKGSAVSLSKGSANSSSKGSAVSLSKDSAVPSSKGSAAPKSKGSAVPSSTDLAVPSSRGSAVSSSRDSAVSSSKSSSVSSSKSSSHTVPNRNLRRDGHVSIPNSTAVQSKRKRNMSPSMRSVRSRVSSSPLSMNSIISPPSKSPVKAVTKLAKENKPRLNLRSAASNHVAASPKKDVLPAKKGAKNQTVSAKSRTSAKKPAAKVEKVKQVTTRQTRKNEVRRPPSKRR